MAETIVFFVVRPRGIFLHEAIQDVASVSVVALEPHVQLFFVNHEVVAESLIGWLVEIAR